MQKIKQNKKQTSHPLEELTSISELVDRLSIENIRLWNLKDEVIALKKELDKGVTKEREQEIYKILAGKAIADVDIVKKRSAVKRAIDELFIKTVKNIMENKNVNISKEYKAYGK